MKKQRISSRVWSCLFMMIFLIISGCAGGGEDVPAVPDNGNTSAYTQADLAGTWSVSKLANDPQWMRGTFSVNAGGQVTCVAYEDSKGAVICPADFNLQWTVGSDGTITESGTNAGANIHMTMTSTFQLIAGTGEQADGGKELRIAQRIGTGYAVTDVQGKSFVFHQLSAGTHKEWRYGSGATDAIGLITMTSETGPADNAITLTGVTISSDADGAVTMSGGGIAAFSGYLSLDKKTIVGTYTNGGDYRVIIIQITGQTYGALPEGNWKAHGLVVGSSSYAPFWVRYDAVVDSGGTINISSFESSQSLAFLLVPDSVDASMTSSGEITSGIMAMHGQAAYDSTFMVSTQTSYTDCYCLTIYTDVP